MLCHVIGLLHLSQFRLGIKIGFDTRPSPCYRREPDRSLGHRRLIEPLPVMLRTMRAERPIGQLIRHAFDGLGMAALCPVGSWRSNQALGRGRATLNSSAHRYRACSHRCVSPHRVAPPDCVSIRRVAQPNVLRHSQKCGPPVVRRGNNGRTRGKAYPDADWRVVVNVIYMAASRRG